MFSLILVTEADSVAFGWDIIFGLNSIYKVAFTFSGDCSLQ